MALPDIIMYKYQESPFAQKIDVLLAIRKIPHSVVIVSHIPPRPELQVLGIDYRRIPVLAINGVVYCDTLAIALALEKAIPVSEEHPSIFPRNRNGSQDIGIQKALMLFWTDKKIFGIASTLLPWTQLSEAFVKDRSEWMGVLLDPKRLAQMRPIALDQLAFHISLIEQQLSDGRDWFCDTVSPGLADASVTFPLQWLQQLRQGREVLNMEKSPRTMQYLSRMSNYATQQAPYCKATLMSSQEAARMIASHRIDDVHASSLSFDTSLASALGLHQGQAVTVTPDDTGKIPTMGILKGLTAEEITIDVTRRDGNGHTRVVYPRFGFVVLPHKQSSL